MKKKIFSVCIAVTMLLGAMPASVYAYSVPDMVKVGLESVCKGASSATIGGGELIVGYIENDRFYEGGEISSGGSFRVSAASASYVAIDEKMDYDEADDLASELSRIGLETYVAYIYDEDWSVYVANASVSAVESKSLMDAEKISGFAGVVLKGGNNAVVLPQGNGVVVQGTLQEDTFSINQKTYRGYLSFAVTGGALTAINTIDLEEYLYGVVPSEMPQSYETEALKAQAVAARTFAMTKLGAHTASGYQLCDTTACQVYKGYSGEATTTSNAIDDTAGIIICYQGSPIEAVFSASTGGYTENCENVWNAPLGYLKAVPEVAEYGDNSWTASITLSELSALLSAKGENIGSAQDIMITKLSTGGRVQEIRIVGTSGSKTLTKEAIRTYFSGAACGSLPGKMFTINGKGGEIGVYGDSPRSTNSNSNSGGTSLLSSLSTGGITLVTEGNLSGLNGKVVSVDADVEGNTSAKTNTGISTDNSGYEVYSVSISTVNGAGKFTFDGIGRGHGVGMSQKGAQSLAQMGYDYDQILKYYYTGVTLEE